MITRLNVKRKSVSPGTTRASVIVAMLAVLLGATGCDGQVDITVQVCRWRDSNKHGTRVSLSGSLLTVDDGVLPVGGAEVTRSLVVGGGKAEPSRNGRAMTPASGICRFIGPDKPSKRQRIEVKAPGMRDHSFEFDYRYQSGGRVICIVMERSNT